MSSSLLFHTYFIFFVFFFLLRSSRTLTQVTVEGHNEVRKKREVCSGIWISQLTYGTDDLRISFLPLEKWSWAKSSHIFQNFIMIWITWGSCTSKYKFPDSLQTHDSEFSEGSQESYVCMCLTGVPGDFYHGKVWETMIWTTLTAILICKFYPLFLL